MRRSSTRRHRPTLLLTTEVMVAEAPNDDEHKHGGMPDIGGMATWECNLSGFPAQAWCADMQTYLEPTPESGGAFVIRGITGKLLCSGRGGRFLIGPESERWDAAMRVQQSSPAAFIAVASDAEYLAGMGHRTAALEDSRLLPLEETGW